MSTKYQMSEYTEVCKTLGQLLFQYVENRLFTDTSKLSWNTVCKCLHVSNELEHQHIYDHVLQHSLIFRSLSSLQ